MSALGEDLSFPSLGWQVIDWIEANLCHGPGDIQGQPITIDDEMAAFVVKAYRLDPGTGRRAVRRAVLSRPKGRAKSEIAGALVCAEALGPVRFDGWDAHGEPVGRPVRSPIIRCLATEEDQAGNTYDNVRVMLSQGPLADELAIDVGLTRTNLPGGGEIVPSTAGAASKDGGKETFAVCDESHLYVLPELRRMHSTVRRNLAKRKIAEPWMLETTTMFRPGEDSVAEATFKHWQAVLEGRAPDPGMLMDHRQATKIENWADDDELRAALIDVYGAAAPWIDIDGILAEIRDPTAEEADSRRYFLNQPAVADDQWIDPEAWARCSDLTRTVKPGELITLGFDGSLRDDATALVGCRVSDGHLFLVQAWEPPLNAPEWWQVPTEEVDAAVAGAFAEFDVWRLYADPPYWQDTLGHWASEFGDSKVIHWWTNKWTQMAHALERLHSAVASQALTHDGDKVLARHVANARRSRNRAGTQIRKEHPKSASKIDAAIAAVLAYEARGDAIVAGAGAKKKYRAAGF